MNKNTPVNTFLKIERLIELGDINVLKKDVITTIKNDIEFVRIFKKTDEEKNFFGYRVQSANNEIDFKNSKYNLDYEYNSKLNKVNILSQDFLTESIKNSDINSIKDIFEYNNININDKNILELCILNNQFEIAKYLYEEKGFKLKDYSKITESNLDELSLMLNLNYNKSSLFTTFNVQQSNVISFSINNNNFDFSPKTPNINYQNILKINSEIIKNIIHKAEKELNNNTKNIPNLNLYSEILTKNIISNFINKFLVGNNIKINNLETINSILHNKNKFLDFNKESFNSTGRDQFLLEELPDFINSIIEIKDVEIYGDTNLKMSININQEDKQLFKNLCITIGNDLRQDHFLQISANNIVDILRKNFANRNNIDTLNLDNELKFRVSVANENLNLLSNSDKEILYEKISHQFNEIDDAIDVMMKLHFEYEFINGLKTVNMKKEILKDIEIISQNKDNFSPSF